MLDFPQHWQVLLAFVVTHDLLALKDRGALEVLLKGAGEHFSGLIDCLTRLYPVQEGCLLGQLGAIPVFGD